MKLFINSIFVKFVIKFNINVRELIKAVSLLYIYVDFDIQYNNWNTGYTFHINIMRIWASAYELIWSDLIFVCHYMHLAAKFSR